MHRGGVVVSHLVPAERGEELLEEGCEVVSVVSVEGNGCGDEAPAVVGERGAERSVELVALLVPEASRGDDDDLDGAGSRLEDRLKYHPGRVAVSVMIMSVGGVVVSALTESVLREVPGVGRCSRHEPPEDGEGGESRECGRGVLLVPHGDERPVAGEWRAVVGVDGGAVLHPWLHQVRKKWMARIVVDFFPFSKFIEHFFLCYFLGNASDVRYSRWFVNDWLQLVFCCDAKHPLIFCSSGPRQRAYRVHTAWRCISGIS